MASVTFEHVTKSYDGTVAVRAREGAVKEGELGSPVAVKPAR